MLFSHETVANFINESFEPVWESVRPVPIVHIDFGNGKVLTRTLHGNILTSICTPDGDVIDALPGIYREAEYLAQLKLLGTVARNARTITEDGKERDKLVRAYHRGRVQELKKNIKPEQVAAGMGMLSIPKNSIERPLELVLLPMQSPPQMFGMMGASQVGGMQGMPPMGGMMGSPPMSSMPLPPRAEKMESAKIAAEDVAHWKELEEDTRLNERARRLWIHSFLEKTGLVKPVKVTRPIYKDVLHADLDDPYLGLGKVLFAKYPFAKEDAAH